jgi:hypothetical protein
MPGPGRSGARCRDGSANRKVVERLRREAEPIAAVVSHLAAVAGNADVATGGVTGVPHRPADAAFLACGAKSEPIRAAMVRGKACGPKALDGAPSSQEVTDDT